MGLVGSRLGAEFSCARHSHGPSSSDAVAPRSSRHSRAPQRTTLHYKSLYLRGTQISDAGLKHIESLSELACLELRGTSVTTVGLMELSLCNASHRSV